MSLVARESRLDRALQAYLQDCEDAGDRIDYVLIDCPPSLGLLTVNAMVAGREVLIPIQCEYYALEGLGQLVRNIELIRSHLNPKLEITTILLTMYDARTRLSAGVAEEVRSYFADKVLKTAIPRSVRISEAPSYQQSVLTYDGHRLARCPISRPPARSPSPEGEQLHGRHDVGTGTRSRGLIPSGPAEAEASGLQQIEGARFAELPLDQIVPNPRQPRQVFDEDHMAELVHSIKEVGLLQPIVVREVGKDRYELIMGERRWRAPLAGRHWTRSAPSSGTPRTRTCSATPCWRTSIGPTSTRWKRPRPTSSCSKTSAARMRSWPTASVAHVLRSATRSGSSS